MSTPKLDLGGVEVRALRDGFLTVDVSEMFGTRRPGRLAEIFPEDGAGRRAISLNCFLIRTPGSLVLVDTGAGSTVEGPLSRSYGYRRDPGLFEALAEDGCRAEDINLVINTHLHFDHCGGNTRKGVSGAFEPAFPRAVYAIQRRAWEFALDPPESERESLVAESYLPLEPGGRLRLVEGDVQVAPAVEVLLTPGHTPGHQSVKVEGKKATLVILGDLVPTSAHAGLSAASAHDLDPAELVRQKKRILERGSAGGWLYGFVHDPKHPFGRISRAGERFLFRPLKGGP